MLTSLLLRISAQHSLGKIRLDAKRLGSLCICFNPKKNSTDCAAHLSTHRLRTHRNTITDLSLLQQHWSFLLAGSIIRDLAAWASLADDHATTSSAGLRSPQLVRQRGQKHSTLWEAVATIVETEPERTRHCIPVTWRSL